jgi:hypothetical protein
MRSIITGLSFITAASLGIAVLADEGISGGDPMNKSQQAQIHIEGKIDGAHEVALTSTEDGVLVDGRIDGGSRVTISAAKDVEIGLTGDSDNKKIDGGSVVNVVAGGHILLGGKIDGGSNVHFTSATGIDILGKIDSGATTVYLKTTEGQKIHIHDRIDGGASVIYWPADALVVDDSSGNRDHVVAQQW